MDLHVPSPMDVVCEYPLTAWYAATSAVGAVATTVHAFRPMAVSPAALLALQGVGAWPGAILTRAVLKPRSLGALTYRGPMWLIVMGHTVALWEYNALTARLGFSWKPMLLPLRYWNAIRSTLSPFRG